MSQSLQAFKADLFKALGHPTRIRILESLRAGEKSVGEMQTALEAEGSTISQQLAILRMKNLVDTRKEGNLIFYRLRDEHVNELLDMARRIFDAHVVQLRSMTEEPKVQGRRRQPVGSAR